mgnify:FL=1
MNGYCPDLWSRFRKQSAFFNEDSDQGITASIKLGTEVAWDNADAYLYFVADQPCMAGETIARFCQ